jgi:hypothetical protein
VADAADFFIKNLSNELHLQKTISNDSIKKLEDGMTELKSDGKLTKE